METALAGCGLNVDARAQDLTLEEFVAFSWQLHLGTVDQGMTLLSGEQEAEGVEESAERREDSSEEDGRGG